MKTYCVKCRKILKILIQKWLQQKITDQLYNQNIMFAKLKSQDL